jgi:hypothetical protein
VGAGGGVVDGRSWARCGASERAGAELGERRVRARGTRHGGVEPAPWRLGERRRRLGERGGLRWARWRAPGCTGGAATRACARPCGARGWAARALGRESVRWTGEGAAGGGAQGGLLARWAGVARWAARSRPREAGERGALGGLRALLGRRERERGKGWLGRDWAREGGAEGGFPFIYFFPSFCSFFVNMFLF